MNQSTERRVVLVGNPNVGKSVVFGYLTGMYAEVSNYPGTTIEIMSSPAGRDMIIDTPGIYGVSSFNDEERVARDVILSADVVVNIVDSVHLDRDLFLTLQLCDMGIPMIVALNFMDEALKEGLKIDVERLSELIGVPVIATTAIRGEGLESILSGLQNAREGKIDPAYSEPVKTLSKSIGSQRDAVLILEGDEVVSKRHGMSVGTLREAIYVQRRRRIGEVVNGVVFESGSASRLSARLGRMMLSPVTGVPIMALVLFAMYELVGVLVAQKLVGFTEGTIMHRYWEPAIRSLLFNWLPKYSPAATMLVGKFGILTMTVTYLMGLLLPLVIGFYLSLAILEDSGYLPRLAALADRLLNCVGLNGRAVIPIILGFGCITMATITTRLLGTKREKTIATSILNFAIPCSAQLGVITLLLGRLGPGYALAFGGIIFTCLAVIGTVLNRVLPGESSPLLIDLPPIRLPRLNNILRKTFSRTVFFMKEAYPWFLVGSVAVAIMQTTGILAAWQNALAPLTVGWLRLPREAADAFVMGMVRRDFGAAGFASMPLTAPQSLVALVSITLFVPCIASVSILFKERSAKEAALIWVGSWVISFLVGGIVAKILIH